MGKLLLRLQMMKASQPLRSETVHRIASGELVPVEVTANYLKHDDKQLVAGYFQDIRGRKKAQEEQLRTQKLESLGVLAGGIAHDFNNLLTGIMGNLSLIRTLLPAGSKAQKRIQSCEKAVREATGLTGQLLTFSKGGEVMVSTKVGEGTLFSVYLPATSQSLIEEEAQARPSAPIGEGYVIVMDDEENIRDIAGEMLAYFGYRFSLCACGEEVVALYKSELERGIRTTAVIMDLTVPGKMGGLEATSQILDLDPSAKIIVSSGYSHDAVMSDYRKYGFSDALAKPFNMEEMSAVLNKIVRGKSEG